MSHPLSSSFCPNSWHLLPPDPLSQSRALQATPSRRQAAPGGLWFRGVDDLAQEEDALGVGREDHHEERPVEPQDSLIEWGGQKGDRDAGGRCGLRAGLVHIQDGLVETLGGKSQHHFRENITGGLGKTGGTGGRWRSVLWFTACRATCWGHHSRDFYVGWLVELDDLLFTQ